MHADPWLNPATLTHPAASLVPLDVSHAEALIDAAETPETFRYFSRLPDPFTAEGMREFIAFLLGPAETSPHAVLDPAGEPVGITTYLARMPAHQGIEIGWTWYAPRVRGTVVNPACKLMLMRHAFETLGAHRLQLRTDARNARSRAAILKLGASFEGEFRENVLMPDGFRRSSVYYSVLAPEWPGVRAGLEARLEALA